MMLGYFLLFLRQEMLRWTLLICHQHPVHMLECYMWVCGQSSYYTLWTTLLSAFYIPVPTYLPWMWQTALRVVGSGLGEAFASRLWWQALYKAHTHTQIHTYTHTCTQERERERKSARSTYIHIDFRCTAAWTIPRSDIFFSKDSF